MSGRGDGRGHVLRDAGERDRPFPAPGARAHLLGLGGAGMRGLAVLLAETGYEVSGCDRAATKLPELMARGIAVEVGHAAEHVAEADLVIRSAAVPETAVEIQAARAAGVPIWKRAEALGALLQGRRVVGIAGTHGKTTITAMLGRACVAAGLDPTVLVGGWVSDWNGFARAGGELCIVEADEFDRSFLELEPALAVVSNVEAEHLETYGRPEHVEEAFRTFARRAAAREGVLYCADDEGARRVCGSMNGRSYGFSEDADYRIATFGAGQDRRGSLRSPVGRHEVHLELPGRHNLQNAAAALAAAIELGADPEVACRALSTFSGVGRRLEVLAEGGGVTIVDDYAHHPTEVRASLAALRERYPDRRLVVVFQPHLYSRTLRLAAEFAAALSAADLALVLPVYGAREEAVPGVTASTIVDAARPETVHGRAGPGGEGSGSELPSAGVLRTASREEALALLAREDSDSVFVFMGAGDVTELAQRAAREGTGHAVET